MKLAIMAGTFAGALGCLAFAGCMGTEGSASDDAINTMPASLIEGRAELEKIDRIMTDHGSTDVLVQQQRDIRDRMDVFAGLVDRIEVAPEHTINFFVSPEGDTIVGERMKIGMPSAMKANSAESIESIYRRLAPGRTVPAALLGPAAIQTDNLATVPSQPGRALVGQAATPATAADSNDIETITSAITDSASDDQWFRDNACPHGNVKDFCLVHRTNSRAVEATSDHSQVNAAFTRGTGSINLNFGPGGGAAPTFTEAILPGEFVFFWWVGPWEDVRVPGCLPWPFACETRREAQKRFKRWAIAGSSTKTHDLGGMFYNNPTNWNTM
jgi:hypothetical protein